MLFSSSRFQEIGGEVIEDNSSQSAVFLTSENQPIRKPKDILTSSHSHDRRLSINIYPAQDLGPAVDDSGVSLDPLIPYTEGNNFDLRGISNFLSSSSNQKMQCAALQLLEHAAEWQSTNFTECMSITFGPVAELVLDSRDIQVHCAALDTLKLFLASPHVIDIVKSAMPRGVVDTVRDDLNSPEPLVQSASVELLDTAARSEDILVRFAAAVSRIPSVLPSMPTATQITALGVLEVSAGSSTYELLKAVADAFQFLIQPLSSPETTVQIAALKVLEAGAGTKDLELARAVKTILPILTEMQSSGETDVSSAARKVLGVGSHNLLIGSTHDDVSKRQPPNDQGHRPISRTEDSSLFIEASTITPVKYFLRLIGRRYDQPSASRTSVVPTSEESSDGQSGVRLSFETNDSVTLVQSTTQTSNYSFNIDPNSVIKKHSFPDASGGLGDVYKCSLNRNARVEEVAVKCPRFPSLGKAEINKINHNLDREISILVKLEHQYVLPLYGTVNGFGPFSALVSPWMPNGTLDSYLHREDLTLTTMDKLHILKQIAEGLKYRK
ncbi:hypothetical protein AZE42_04468 [Rhizopogon vesiculosus]|uniref:Protein kinase domain-containing protein n=1 Tax=Rhizopogon vesiculosus TaxID=180088 RepID=A0A1J8QH94_9AGAM|nr:hypothetical protein AZE42_04468 [Rhizopogon vesiculosus]